MFDVMMRGKFEELESAAAAFNRSSELDSIVITPGPRLEPRRRNGNISTNTFNTLEQI